MKMVTNHFGNRKIHVANEKALGAWIFSLGFGGRGER
jgi:hypothetical protein